MSRRLPILALLLLALVAGGAAGCSEHDEPIEVVTVRADSVEARRDSMVELRAAWRGRRVKDDARGRAAETRFLIRLSSAVRRFKDTESYNDICRFWNECLKDHRARFPETAR